MERRRRWAWLGLLAALAACGDDSAGNDVPGDTSDVVDSEETGADADADADVEPDVVDDVPDETPGPDADADADSEAETTTLACDDVAEGWNRGFQAGGRSRDFLLDLPADAETDGPWPVVFNFHGMGDTAENMRTLMSSAVDDAAFPFILVTPEDSNFSLMGLPIDWDVATVTTENREAVMFDEILACLETRWGVDEDHVHVVGFSMGAFVTDALGTVRGEQLASVVTFSGAYGNNDANLADLGMLASAINWPDYETTNRYAQVFLHGGTTDTYSVGGFATMHFDRYAANDSVFLGALGHDTFVCDHGGGHTVPAGFMAPQIAEFFREHPRGTVTSPYSAGPPVDWPDYCTYVPGTGGADGDADADAGADGDADAGEDAEIEADGSVD